MTPASRWAVTRASPPRSNRLQHHSISTSTHLLLLLPAPTPNYIPTQYLTLNCTPKMTPALRWAVTRASPPRSNRLQHHSTTASTHPLLLLLPPPPPTRPAAGRSGRGSVPTAGGSWPHAVHACRRGWSARCCAGPPRPSLWRQRCPAWCHGDQSPCRCRAGAGSAGAGNLGVGGE